ncbi:MAG TPA: hypothetical protein VKT29_13780 [Terriglobales bacterium]|nr:hypothetical protein [Terriglobales bacterium]
MISRFVTKTAAITTVVVVSNAVGNYTLSKGMQEVGHLVTWQPGPYLEAFANRWVIAGVLLLIAWLIFRLALLSWADLSYVITVTSTSYVISALLGKFFLAEQVSTLRWVGIALITVGAAFVGETFPSTTDETGGLAEE